MRNAFTYFLCWLLAGTQGLWAQGGEDCGTATVIPSIPYTDNGSTTGFVDDYDEVCPFNNPGAPDVVYQYAPTVSQVVDVSLCSGTTNYDTKLYVYENGCPASGTGSSGVFYACNDDACDNAPIYNSPFISTVSGVVMTPGNTYYIVVDGYNAFSSGNYTIDLFPTPGNAKVVTVTAPEIAGCPFTASETVSCTYTNNGTPVDSIFLSLRVDGNLVDIDTVLGLIGPGDTLAHTFAATADLSGPGFHEVEAAAAAPMDGDPGDDAILRRVRNFDLQAFPLPTVTFTGYNGGNLSTLSPNWGEAQGDLTLTSFPTNGFFVPWNQATGPQLTALGSETAQINLWTTGSSGWLVGPRFTASANYRLVFKAAVMAFGSTNASNMGSDDAVYVMVSNDCGITWTPVLLFSPGNVPGNTLTTYQADLSTFAGQEIIVGFYATDGTINDPEDYNFHLDDIQVIDITQQDAALASIIEPSGDGCDLSTSEPVTIEINNLAAAVPSVSATLIVDGATVVTDVITGPFATGANFQHTFSVGADLSGPGLHEIEVVATAPTDINPGNDTLSTIIENILPLPLPIPTLTFDGFTFGNLNQIYPLWETADGEPPVFTPFSAWQGSNVLGNPTARANIWNAFTRAWMIGPRVQVTPQTRLRFDAAITGFFNTNPATMDTDDSLSVMISTDCGNTWTPIFAIDQNNQPGNVLTPFEVDLSPYAGQGVYLAFFANSNDAGGDIDAHLDNIQLANFFPIDVGVTSLLAPNSGCDLTGIDSISIEFTHLGTDTVFGPVAIPLAYSLDGGATIIPDTLAVPAGANVPPGSLVPFTFATPTDLSTLDTTYTLSMWTDLGDPQTANDTLTQRLRTYAPAQVSSGIDSAYCAVDDTLMTNATYDGGLWEGLGIVDSATGAINPSLIGDGNTAMITYSYDRPYGLAEIPFAPQPVGANATVMTLFDDDAETIPIGFDFNFFGEFFQEVSVGSNGFLSFGESSTSLGNQTLPDPFAPNNLVAFAWDDLNPSAGGTVTYELMGTAPDRMLTITFTEVPHFGSSGAEVTVQTILYESTDVIEIHVTEIEPDAFGGMTQGLENADGTLGFATTDSTNDEAFNQDSVAYRFVPTPCPGYDTVMVTVGVPPLFTADTVGICSDDSITLDVPLSGGSYLWGTGDTTQSITVSSGGQYLVDIITSIGCAGSDSITVEVFPEIALSVDSIFDNACPGDSLGAIQISATGGAGTLSYTWNTGDSTANLTNLPAGAYTLTVTDEEGCRRSTDTLTVEVLGDLPTADFSFTLNGAQADFNSSGSSDADSYFWDFGDGVTSTDENPSYFYPSAGTYTITLIVENECGSDTITQELSIATSLREGWAQTEMYLQPNPNAGRFSLRFVGEPLTDVSLQLIDARGKVVYQQILGRVQNGDTHTLDRSDRLSEGVYLLRLRAAEGHLTRRVVIVSR
jgi:hypothetical protein